MDVTELAHWRYRVKALTLDVSRHVEKLNNAQMASGPRIIPQVKWDALVGELVEQLDFEQWLLQEALYMSELGAI